MARLSLAFAVLLPASAVAQVLPLGGTLAPPPPVVAPSGLASPGLAPLNTPGSRSPALVTGTSAAPRTIVIPGSPVPGTLLDNGNGTSTVLVPGGASQVIPTPR